MIGRIICAFVVVLAVGLVCMYLLGPLILQLQVPPAQVIGGFLVTWGWAIGVLAGLWYFFSGTTWPLRRS